MLILGIESSCDETAAAVERLLGVDKLVREHQMATKYSPEWANPNQRKGE